MTASVRATLGRVGGPPSLRRLIGPDPLGVNVCTSAITGNPPQPGDRVPDRPAFFDCPDCGLVAVTRDEVCPALSVYPARHRPANDPSRPRWIARISDREW